MVQKRRRNQGARKIIPILPRHEGASRSILRGIYHYAYPGKDWDFLGSQTWERISKEMPALRRDWDGAIGGAGRKDLSALARKLGLPFVNIYGGEPFFPDIPQVGTDDRAIGRMAGEYLAGLGLKHFAFFGFGAGGLSVGRLEGFGQALSRRGLEVEGVCEEGGPVDSGADEEMVDLLKQLPRPVGILCVSDMVGVWVGEHCRHLGISVPDEAAILGVKNDDVRCDATWPRLSSIEIPSEAVGFQAAQLLDEILRGRKPPKAPILFPPVRVVERQSTDIQAAGDPRVARAITFIRDNLLRPRSDELSMRPITPEEVAGQTRDSRRELDRRFRKLVGRTVFDEIRRRQLVRVKERLSKTNMSIDEIAIENGFRDEKALGRTFTTVEGLPPGAWRKQFHKR